MALVRGVVFLNSYNAREVCNNDLTRDQNLWHDKHTQLQP